MKLPWMIVRRKDIPKVERKLDLEHFYTFKTGEKLYTYKVDQLALISGRYLDQVKNTINFMLQYQAGPEQVKAFSNNIKKEAMQALEGKADRVEVLAKIVTIAESMPKLQDYVDDLHKRQWLDLYVMFTVLDGEQETLFTPKWNARKIELLEAEGDEFAEKAFFFVQALMINFSSTYREDTLKSMLQERDLASLAASMTALTMNPNITSPSADGPASE